MSENMIRIINDDGSLNPEYKVDLEEKDFKEMYRLMVLTRTYEERSIKLQRQGRIGFYIGCKGQEASHIGSAYALKHDEWIYPAYREPGVLFMRGVSVKSMVAQMIGNSGDPAKGRQMPCHYTFAEAHYGSISSPLATQIPHAVGAAFANKYQGKKEAVITYFGDGSTSEGDFHAGLNFAAVFKAPVVFICQNNKWAISVPFSKQTATENIAVKAVAYGMPGVLVDGNDILAVYYVSKQAAERARNGEGPTLIESNTYRLGPHSSSDDDKRYRPESELSVWKKKDPIFVFEKFLKKQGLMNEDDFARVKKDCDDEIAKAIKEAEKFAPVPLESLFTDVYKDIPPHLHEQMIELIEEQKRLGESVNDTEAFPL